MSEASSRPPHRHIRPKSIASLFLLIAATLAALPGYGQMSEPLKAAQPRTVTLAAGEETIFVISLKRDEYAEVSWLANDELPLAFSLRTPSGVEMLGEMDGEDVIAFIAREDGDHRLTVKLNPAPNVEPQRITLRYTDKFKLPARTIQQAARKINGYDVRILESPGDDAEAFLLVEKNGKLRAIRRAEGTGAAGFYFADDVTHTYSPEERRSALLIGSRVLGRDARSALHGTRGVGVAVPRHGLAGA